MLQVDALFELIKGLIKDFDGLADNDEVLNHIFDQSLLYSCSQYYSHVKGQFFFR